MGAALVVERFGELKTRIKERVDLVDLIESYVPLRPRGRHLEALCPFHEERTPSFKVFPDTQHFKCFGCGKGGDAFTEYSLPEAILKLRQGVGRLIRTRSDHGIVVILDNRIVTRPYGRAFMQALPECPVKVI